MAAKTKPIQVKSLVDLGVDAATVGLSAAATQVVSWEPAPPRAAGQTVKDEGDGAVSIVDFLAGKKLI
jgi:electron transfer flavoprotein beta subunit